MSLFTLLTLTLLLAGCASREALPPGIGHGEPLALHTADGFGPINNGFISQMTLGDWNADGWNDLIVFSTGYNGGLFLYRCIPGDGVPCFEERERIDGRYGLPALGEDGIFWWSERAIGPSWWLDTTGDRPTILPRYSLSRLSNHSGITSFHSSPPVFLYRRAHSPRSFSTLQ